MKNLMTLAAALLVATPAGAVPAANANVNFQVQVANTCHLIGVTAQAVQQLNNGNASVANYTALSNSNASSFATPAGLAIECTKGTAVTVTATPLTPSGAPTTITSPNWGVASAPASMTLNSNGNTLYGTYSVTVNRTPSASQTTGDRYNGSVSYTPTANQWGAPAGLYTGTLNITFEYN